MEILIFLIYIVKPTISIWNLVTQKKNGYAISNFLPVSGFKWLDTKEFDLNKYTCNSSKGCVLKVDPECPKELRELHNDYPLVPDKIKIKKETLPEYQLKIADLYNIPVFITFLIKKII